MIDFIRRGSKVSAPFSLLMKGRGKGKRNRGTESMKVALLEEYGPPAEVPKGFLAVYVGEDMRRFVIPTSYLYRPDFQELMERVSEEFGFNRQGGLWFPVEEERFLSLLKDSSAAKTSKKKKNSRKRS